MTDAEDEEQSLDLVQRVIISSLVVVVFGSLSAVLGAYVAGPQQDVSHSDAVGLWLMSGVLGLIAAVAVLVINRHKPYSPWALLGLLPMAVSAYWLFN
jgi:hypothetical protein